MISGCPSTGEACAVATFSPIGSDGLSSCMGGLAHADLMGWEGMGGILPECSAAEVVGAIRYLKCRSPAHQEACLRHNCSCLVLE